MDYNQIEKALHAAEQCMTDVYTYYKNGTSNLVMDEAMKSLKNDGLKLVKQARAALTPAPAPVATAAAGEAAHTCTIHDLQGMRDRLSQIIHRNEWGTNPDFKWCIDELYGFVLAATPATGAAAATGEAAPKLACNVPHCYVGEDNECHRGHRPIQSCPNATPATGAAAATGEAAPSGSVTGAQLAATMRCLWPMLDPMMDGVMHKWSDKDLLDAHSADWLREKAITVLRAAATPAPAAAAAGGGAAWVPVTERLPESKEGHWPNRVLIARPISAFNTNAVSTGYYDNGGWYAEGEDYDGDALLDNTVTHWQPLPPAPATTAAAAMGETGQTNH